MATPLIEFRDVSKRFGEKVVLDRANLLVYPGEVTTLIGKSGVGKSVTLKLIIGLLSPDAGEILFSGRPVSGMSRRDREAFKKRVNFMFQNNALFDSMSVFENIALPLLENTRYDAASIRERVRQKMEALDLGGVEGKFPSQLSGGMQKRVALARALATDPEVVLFDEPTTGLDPVRKNSVLSMITHNQKNFGFTAMLVSHDVPDVFYISNRIAVIEEGEILFQGRPQDLEQTRHPVIHDFINSTEGLQNEIIGLETRRSLEQHFQERRDSPQREEPFFILLLTVSNFERIKERVGHLVAHDVVASLMQIFQQSWGDSRDIVCGRFSQDRVVCLLPNISGERLQKTLTQMSRELQRKSFFQESAYTDTCVNFSVYAGGIQGSAMASLHELVDRAGNELRYLAGLVCGKSGEA
jgi:phospholipid/cholesterol/gamma-HCH transport system ATP-binding protein